LPSNLNKSLSRSLVFAITITICGTTASAVDFRDGEVPSADRDLDADADLSVEPKSPMERAMDREVDDDQARDGELHLTQKEIRQDFRKAASVAVGPSNPWMTVGLQAHYTENVYGYWTLAMGTGRWSFQGSEDDIDYAVKSNIKSMQLHRKFFPHDLIPLWIGGLAGLGFWDGTLDPTGINEGDEEYAAEVFKTSFQAVGLIGGVSVGVTYLTESKWFFEYTAFCVSKAVLISEDYTSESSIAGREVREALGRTSSWGLLNFTVGHLL
jgi:hypothetical protein